MADDWNKIAWRIRLPKDAPPSLMGEVRGALEDACGLFTFEGLLPMPLILYLVQDDSGAPCDIVYASLEDMLTNGKTRRMTDADRQALKDTGHSCWTDWASEHWGSKWGPGYARLRTDVDDADIAIDFEVSSGGAEPMEAAFRARFPTVALDASTP